MFSWPVSSERTSAWRARVTLHLTIYIFPEGFGQVLLGTIRQARQLSLHKPVEFPLTLGRDFCGEIVAKGVKVNSDLKIGDTVMGVVPPFQQGCHAEFVSVSEGLVWN